jgi:hypothetical protein
MKTRKLHKTLRKTKKSFLFNPHKPKHTFNIFDDDNPHDTIPIKFKTIDDVKNTIHNLETLYKNKKYTHKRIWQVGMILHIRLNLIKHKKPLQAKLAKKYFLFLKKRTTLPDRQRYSLIFKP